MKTILKSLYLWGTVVVMSACSSNTPSAVVEEGLDCILSGDYKGYVKLMQLATDDDSQNKEKVIEEFADMVEKEAAKGSDKEKLKDYEILQEELSKTGTYAKVTYKQFYVAGDEKESSLYLVKNAKGNWEIMLWGSDRLMDE